MSEHFVSGVSAKIALYKYSSFPYLHSEIPVCYLSELIFPLTSADANKELHHLLMLSLTLNLTGLTITLTIPTLLILMLLTLTLYG